MAFALSCLTTFIATDKMHKTIRGRRFLVLDPITVDARLARLDHIKKDLDGALEAVTELQLEARSNKRAAEELQQKIDSLEKDKQTFESLLQAPEESLERFFDRINSKDRNRGRLEGVAIGLVTGALSSYIVWYLTK